MAALSCASIRPVLSACESGRVMVFGPSGVPGVSDSKKIR